MPAFKKRPRPSRPSTSVRTPVRLNAHQLKRVFAVVVLVLLVSGVSLATRTVFGTHHVYCTVESQNCPSDVTSTLTQLEGELLLGTNFTTRANEILAATPFRVVSWYSTLPGKLHLSLAQDPAAYRLQTSDADVFVSTSGIVTTTPEQAKEQVLAITTTASLADILSETGEVLPTLHTSLKTLDTVRQDLPVEDVQWDEQTLQLNLTDGFIILMLVSDVPRQLERATLVLASPEFTERAAEVSVLDLRFRLPVLRNSL